uniref:Histidine kinase, HAMP region:Bacterial chemotaxis sensory transducer n=1 Tax=Dechloromonas aromatica (strain RCB) TaxID=159087 RepID=Q47BW8_DECAR
MFSRLTIKVRLIFAFTALIILLLVSNILALQRLAESMQDMDTLVKDRVFKLNTSYKLVESVLKNGGMLRAILLVDSNEERAALEAKISANRKLNSELIEKLDPLVRTERGRKILDHIKETRAAQSSLYGKYFEALDRSPAEARLLLSKEFAPKNDALISAVKEMASLQDENMQSDVARNRAEYESARNRAIGGLIVGVLLAFGAAVWIIRSITGPLSSVRDVITLVCDKNDFTATVRVDSEDEVGQAAKAFNELLATLRKTLDELKRSIGEVDVSAHSLSSAASQSAQASAMSSESAAAMAASVEQVSVSINQVSDNAHTASDLARQAGSLSDEGGRVIGDAVTKIRHIADAIDRVASMIGALGEQSKEISSIVQVIKDVADQTNLLALNAAIEAARAGEAGRGFAVVADEVRKLAERTTKATGEISTMIETIQSSSLSAVDAMHETVQEVRTGTELAEQAGQSIVDIRRAAGEVVSVVADIAGSIAEQSSATQSLAQQLEMVAQSAEENNAAADETASSAHRLGELAHTMRLNTDRFKI